MDKDLDSLRPIIPFEPVSVQDCPQGNNWIAQIKWDGVRMLTYYDGSQVRLINRRLNDRTMQYPELLTPAEYCSASSFIIDGEMIALHHNKPSFEQVMKRDRLQRKQRIESAVAQIPVTYMIFDVVYINGNWINDLPLIERQKRLQDIVIPSNRVQLVANFPSPELLLQVMRQHQMEGIVCKDLTSSYAINGKDKRWQKIKLFRDLFAVVGGVTYRGNIVNSLLLGVYDPEGGLVYIGHAGTGKVTQQEWREITNKAASLSIGKKPFVNEPERSKEAIWIKPEMVVKVQFLEWTSGGTLRHPSIQAFMDIPPSECTVEQAFH